MRYFLDTEFNGMNGDLISLALVSEDGRELYLVVPCQNPIQWVADNVMPIIHCSGAHPIMDNPALIGASIATFLQRDPKPYIIADWPDDIAYFCKALIVGPGKMVDIPSLAFEIIRVDVYPTDMPEVVQHNALWDARALRRKIVG
jgi:hypothetical protein